MTSAASGEWCVYTALFGAYEELLEQPVALESPARFICFTDDPSLTSETWDVRVVRPLFPSDPVRSARAVKIGSGRAVPEFRHSLWIDNAVLLHEDPVRAGASWLREHDIAIPDHFQRETLLDEFTAVVELGKDDAARVYDQLFHYQRGHGEVLDESPFQTSVVARRRSDAVAAFEDLWLAHVLRFSRRDQLSVNVALREAGLPVLRLDLPLPFGDRQSFASWPRSVRPAERAAEAVAAPPSIRLRQLERTAESLTEAVAGLQEALVRRGGEIEEIEAGLAAARRRQAELEAELHVVYASRSWRLSGIGRRLARIAAGRR